MYILIRGTSVFRAASLFCQNVLRVNLLKFSNVKVSRYTVAGIHFYIHELHMH